ncbi:MAG: helix-turn-helix domain-containing protein, partial [Candidatus Thermoplasmatota archaeon]|nr:helix-turn-helix domain-containing protein [Candidatus Thermoplasmatota archaeon]
MRHGNRLATKIENLLTSELSNVSRACKVMGVSRDTFYRYRELVDDGGVDALIEKSRR